MYKTLFLLCALIAGTAEAALPSSAGLSASSAESRPEPRVEIVSADFGTFDDSNPRETVFESTRRVPHRQGQRYGWIIEVRTARRSLSVSEEYLLPNSAKDPAKARPSPENSTVVLDIPQPRRNQISQRQLVPVGGMITGEWAVGPSEPAGHRVLQVMVEGQVAAVFEFDVK